MTSGIRIGTPAVTTRKMKEEEMDIIGELIGKVLCEVDSTQIQQEVLEEVKSLTSQFPLYSQRLSIAQSSVG